MGFERVGLKVGRGVAAQHDKPLWMVGYKNDQMIEPLHDLHDHFGFR